VIILDTNVISAMMSRVTDARVTSWLDAQSQSTLWVTSLTFFEVRYGIQLLPKSKKRDRLLSSFEQTMDEIFAARTLTFDLGAANAAATLAAQRKRKGHVVDMRDTLIAGIAIAKGATLATRNERDFFDAGVPIVNPWTTAQ
jgi:toxin FitB